MDNIFEINDKFDFSNLTLNDPILINNNYFSKISYGKYNKNLYLKLNKCFSKNGIVKTSNKCFCELNYIINENNSILEFFEKLENLCLDKIINNKDKWFYNSDNISNNDIEELLTPTCKSYKYGKNILIKTFILNNKLLIYDEEENKLNLEDFNINNEVIPLIHINGIKFSNRTLILDITLKQILLLNPSDDLENKCLLLNKSNVTNIKKNLEEKENLKQQHLEKENLKEENNNSLVNIELIDIEDIGNETFNIKTRDTIYLEMYKTAKKKSQGN